MRPLFLLRIGVDQCFYVSQTLYWVYCGYRRPDLHRRPHSSSAEKPEAPAKGRPAWIWLSDKPKHNQTVYFRKAFEIANPINAVTLQAACADHSLTLFL